jgi:hypothetical protein
MNHAPRAASSWKLLRRNLGGFFTARARGLLATEFTLLDPEGKEFGRLRLVGSSGAELRSGNHIATFEASEERYRMVAGNNEVLTAAPKGLSIDKLEVYCDNQTYEAQVSFFRNLAVASHVGDARKVRVSGDLTGRNYETLFAAEDRCALPVAVFLLWHVATNRRGAFRAGSLARGGVA